jgi:chromosome partitioning protein
MRQLAGKYDRIIIDVGGRATGSLRAALTVADAILIPFQPRSVDLWTAAEMSALVGEARHVNDRLRAYAVLNLADPQGTDNAEAAAALATIEGIEALPVVVVRRKAFPNAFSSGLSVFEQSATEVDGWNKLSRVSQNRAAVHEIGDGHGFRISMRMGDSK